MGLPPAFPICWKLPAIMPDVHTVLRDIRGSIGRGRRSAATNVLATVIDGEPVAITVSSGARGSEVCVYVFDICADLSDCDAQVLLYQLVNETNPTTTTMVTNCIWTMQAASRPRALTGLLSHAQDAFGGYSDTLSNR